MPRKPKTTLENPCGSGQVKPLCASGTCSSPIKSNNQAKRTGSVSRRSYKSNIIIAELEAKHRKRELELERALMEAERKLERARLSASISDSDDRESLMTEMDPVTKVHEYIDQFADQACHSNMLTSSPFTSLINSIELPKVELSYFDGSATAYLKFIKQFEFHVEARTTDCGQRLMYLLHYCRGRAREAIDECILLPPSQAYPRARGILKDLFGQKFHVARALIDDLLKETKVISTTQDSLMKLHIKMQNCSIALKELNYEADLNSITTMEKIVRGLPTNLQFRWAEFAEKVATSGFEPTFSDLMTFISERSRVANSRFGILASSSSNRNERSYLKDTEKGKEVSFRPRAAYMNRNSFATSVAPIERCSLCRGQHKLQICQQFLACPVDERWIEARRVGACFICLRNSHRASDCKTPTLCGNNGCRGRHHTLLHRARLDTLQTGDKPEFRACNFTSKTKTPGRLGVLPVCVQTPRGLVRTYAFLDSGSNTTLVKKNFAVMNGLNGSTSRLTITTVNSSRTDMCYEIKLKLMPLNLSEVVEINSAFTVEDLPIKPVNSIIEEANRWPHLQDIDFDELRGSDVNILIGADAPEVHWALEQRTGKRKQPYAVRTLLGWVLCGPLEDVSQYKSVHYIACDDTDSCLRAIYNADFADLASVNMQSVEDKLAVNIVREKLIFENGHYYLPLPWKTSPSKLPNNFVLAKKRFDFLKSRFIRDAGLFERYKTVMDEHIQKGYIEKIEEQACSGIWYLPHHPVMNPKKPDKLRVVYDCAAKYQNVSLNDCLLQGPDITNKLVVVLTRFRIGSIGVAADIKEMFLQVRVPQADRRALRLLWLQGDDLFKPPAIYQMTAHPFGAVSSPFCANFALQQVVDDFGHMFDTCVTDAVRQNFYVDDLLASTDSVDDAITLVKQITSLLYKGGFHLTKWISNCREVTESVNPSDRATSLREFKADSLSIEKMLGICWDSETDEFVISLKLPNKQPTRRGMLSALSSVYDPLGFVSPWLMPGKILLQELCRKRVSWDDKLSLEDEKKWKDWTDTLTNIKDIRISRCIQFQKSSSEIHVFCDASEVGYGVVAYIRNEISSGHGSCKFIMSKARVAPLKSVSIPRLELSSAVLAVRLWLSMKESLGIELENVTFWTDSVIVLHYINNDATRFSTFVANRISIIRDATPAELWRHVPSCDNPADKASRGLRNTQDSERWIRGPKFLERAKDHWPSKTPVQTADGVEYKRLNLHISVNKQSDLLFNLCSRFSDWHRMLKAVVWLTRFKSYWLMMKRPEKNMTLKVGVQTIDELKIAELNVIQLTQMQAFNMDLRTLATREPVGNIRLPNIISLNKLNAMVFNGIIRVGGRLTMSTLSFEAKHPVILPKQNTVTDMIIRYYHQIEGHASVAHLAATIRQRFWVINGVASIRRVIRQCMLCRKQAALAGQQQMAPLPPVRVQPGWHPFIKVGLDYFGPFEVKRGRSTEKRYGCIITCLQSRAVHVDVAQSLSTDSFIMMLIRFIGRRGVPTDIFSDNGSNFKGADTELKKWIENLDTNSLNEKLLQKGIQWHFNPPYASHRGGVWERLIRSVRRILSAVCREQTLDDETLQTFLIESERILNNRPIVPHISGDISFVALTPNDLLLLRGNCGLTFIDTMFERYRARWKTANHLASVFWKRWTREYLPLLQQRQKWYFSRRNFKAGDVVLVVTGGLKRNHWPMGVVENVHSDSDGLVRTVDVRTNGGVVNRDVRNLCLLEGYDDKQNSGESLSPDAKSTCDAVEKDSSIVCQ